MQQIPAVRKTPQVYYFKTEKRRGLPPGDFPTVSLYVLQIISDTLVEVII